MAILVYRLAVSPKILVRIPLSLMISHSNTQCTESNTFFISVQAAISLDISQQWFKALGYSLWWIAQKWIQIAPGSGAPVRSLLYVLEGCEQETCLVCLSIIFHQGCHCFTTLQIEDCLPNFSRGRRFDGLICLTLLLKVLSSMFTDSNAI